MSKPTLADLTTARDLAMDSLGLPTHLLVNLDVVGELADGRIVTPDNPLSEAEMESLNRIAVDQFVEGFKEVRRVVFDWWKQREQLESAFDFVRAVAVADGSLEDVRIENCDLYGVTAHDVAMQILARVYRWCCHPPTLIPFDRDERNQLLWPKGLPAGDWGLEYRPRVEREYELGKGEIDKIEVQASQVKGGSEIEKSKIKDDSLDERLLAVLVVHPDWENKQFAQAVGCHVKSITQRKCPRFFAAKASYKSSNLPRGSKDSEGHLEAWDEG